MADGQHDIESIVREVLRRLLEHDVRVESERKPETAPAAPSDQEQNGQLTIPDRVVTLATIQDRLHSMRQVVLQRGAVVTPAVRDELRRRRVAITYGCSASPDTSECALLVGVAETNYRPESLVKVVESVAGGVKQIDADTVSEALRLLVPPVASGQSLGLLFTGQPAAAMCLANRNAGVRAVLGVGRPCVAEAVDAIGANLLVVDPARRSHYEMKEIVQAFSRPGRRDCPPRFQKLLESG
jgi:hypothetical protein